MEKQKDEKQENSKKESVKKQNSEQKKQKAVKKEKEEKTGGISQKELAALLGMSESAFTEFKKRYPVLADLPEETEENLKIERGKMVKQVERTLLRCCTGYTVSNKKYYKLKNHKRDENGEIELLDGKPIPVEELQEVIEESYIPPDLSAIQFFLLNRSKKDWKKDHDKLSIEKKRLEQQERKILLEEEKASGIQTEGMQIEEILEMQEMDMSMRPDGEWDDDKTI